MNSAIGRVCIVRPLRHSSSASTAFAGAASRSACPGRPLQVALQNLVSPGWASGRTAQSQASRRAFTFCHSPLARQAHQQDNTEDPDAKARNLHQESVEKEEQGITDAFARKKQRRRPWHREGSGAQPPADSGDPTNGDNTRGRLLTTPTRLLKLILPIPLHADKAERTQSDSVKSSEANEKEEQEDIQPLALLVHPQQPLSYLERLLQAEVPPIRDGDVERIPNIIFRAEADLGGAGSSSDKSDSGHEGSSRKSRRDGDDQLNSSSSFNGARGDDGNVASYSGLGHEGPARSDREANWVRWSSSTEIGDFIRDAARGREFAVSIEGQPRDLRVAVPSFNDRTFYMRGRLRKMSQQIESQAAIKKECDRLAHKGVQRIAQGGFGVLVAWWGAVYYVTFHTGFGWDLVEPVTYLVGLTTIIGGYMWFLYISHDLSYKAALNVTVSRKQQALYATRGFDLDRWDGLVQEANSLRREIKMIASEYDVDWNETRDLGGREVKKVLEREEQETSDKSKNGGKAASADEQEDDDVVAQANGHPRERLS